MGGPALVRHLDRLEADGHRRSARRDDADRRIVRLTLTDAGQARLEEIGVVIRRCDEEVRAVLDADEQAVLQTALDKVFAFALSQLEGTEPHHARCHEEHTMTTTTSPADTDAGDRGTTTPSSDTVGLTKVYPGDVRAVDGLDLVGPPRRDLRAARPERRRQDDHRRDAHHPRDPDRRAARSSAASTSSRTRPRPSRLIGVVPQTNTLDRSLTVWENLYFHGRFFGMDATTAQGRGRPGCSSSSGSPSGPTAPVLALSGGMAQRLMVARAVMHRPSILFLDEPTAGLDPQSRIALWEILGELHVDGQTILLTTHYMEEADQLCDRRRDHRPRPDRSPSTRRPS